MEVPFKSKLVLRHEQINIIFLKLQYIDLAKRKSGTPGLFILTGCRISENKRLWNCPPFGFPGNCLIMSFSSLPSSEFHG